MRATVLFLFAFFVVLSSTDIFASDTHYVLKLEFLADGSVELLEVKEAQGAYTASHSGLKKGAYFRYELLNSQGSLKTFGQFKDPRRLSALFDEKMTEAGQALHYNGRFDSAIKLLRVPAIPNAILHIYIKGLPENGFKEFQQIFLSAFPVVKAEEKKANGDVEIIEHNGPPDNRLNIIILGDGYTASEQDKLYNDAV